MRFSVFRVKIVGPARIGGGPWEAHGSPEPLGGPWQALGGP
jgi:hypothetical protein